MTIKALYPTVRPTLNLDFAKTKALDPRVTFTRASTATFVRANGLIQTAPSDVPRFDHNPTTGESLGLLVEEQRTNLRTYSDAILSGNGYGVNVSTLATITTATPTGSATASLFTMNVGANTGNNTDGFNFGSSITLANSTQHTQSLFVKPAGATVLRLRSNISGLVFDFTLTGNGTAPSPISDLQSASIVALANGWYRVSWTFTTTTSAPGNRGDYWTIKTNVADGTNGVYVVGAQLEAGSFPTSYIPTTTATATRSADVASITGTAFSEWYRQDEGTVFSAFSIPTSSTTSGARVYSISNSGATTQAWLRLQGGTNRVYEATDSSTQQAVLSAGTFSAGVLYRGAVALKTNDFGFSENGSTPTVDNSGTLGTVDRMGIGMDSSGSTPLNGHIRRLTYWPQALPSQLQALTAT